VEVKLVCDYCRVTDKGNQRGVRTRRWGLDGTGYEVEVCGQHDELLDKTLTDWSRASRKAGTKPKEIGRQAKKQVESKTKPEPVDRTDFMSWAAEMGYSVNPDAKRLPGPLVKKYRDAKAPAA
jgi:hypothetical protein